MTARLVFSNGVVLLTVNDGTLIERQYPLARESQFDKSSEIERAIIAAFNAGKTEKAREVRLVIGAGEPGASR